jgi:hypothetical protein
MIERDLDLQQARKLSGLLGSLLLLFAACYFIQRQTFSRKYNPHFPLLGHTQSAKLREIVETQWRKVDTPAAFPFWLSRGLIRVLAGQESDIHVTVAFPATACPSKPLRQ